MVMSRQLPLRLSFKTDQQIFSRFGFFPPLSFFFQVNYSKQGNNEKVVQSFWYISNPLDHTCL